MGRRRQRDPGGRGGGGSAARRLRGGGGSAVLEGGSRPQRGYGGRLAERRQSLEEAEARSPFLKIRELSMSRSSCPYLQVSARRARTT